MSVVHVGWLGCLEEQLFVKDMSYHSGPCSLPVTSECFLGLRFSLLHNRKHLFTKFLTGCLSLSWGVGEDANQRLF